MSNRAAIEAGKAVVRISGDNSGLRRSLASSESTIKRWSGGAFAAGTKLLAAGTAAGAALLWPVKLAANLETAAISFEVLTGSQAESARLMQEMRDLAASTPLEFAGLADGAKTLLAFNVQLSDVMPTLRQIGDISGGDPERFSRIALAFGQVASAGRLMGQDVLQLVNAGFNPLQEISRRTGESMLDVRKRMEAGAISFDEVKQAFADATGPGGRFFGMMDKQSRTLTGTWTRLKDAAALAALPIGEALAPAIKFVADKTITALDAARQLTERHKGLAVAAGVLTVGAIAAGAGLIGLSTAGFLASSALGGALLIGKLFALTVAAIASPVGLVTAGVIGLGLAVANFTRVGSSSLTGLASRWPALKKTALDTVDGIASALSAGDIALAGRIGMAGLKVAWLTGLDALTGPWATWSAEMKGLAADAFFGVENLAKKLWINIQIEFTKSMGTVAGLWDKFVDGFHSAQDFTASMLIELNPTISADEKRQQQEILAENQSITNQRRQAAQQPVRDARTRAMNDRLAELDKERTDLDDATGKAVTAARDAFNQEAADAATAAANNLAGAQAELDRLNAEAAAKAAARKAAGAATTPGSASTPGLDGKPRDEARQTFSGGIATQLGHMLVRNTPADQAKRAVDRTGKALADNGDDWKKWSSTATTAANAVAAATAAIHLPGQTPAATPASLPPDARTADSARQTPPPNADVTPTTPPITATTPTLPTAQSPPPPPEQAPEKRPYKPVRRTFAALSPELAKQADEAIRGRALRAELAQPLPTRPHFADTIGKAKQIADQFRSDAAGGSDGIRLTNQGNLPDIIRFADANRAFENKSTTRFRDGVRPVDRFQTLPPIPATPPAAIKPTSFNPTTPGRDNSAFNAEIRTLLKDIRDAVEVTAANPPKPTTYRR